MSSGEVPTTQALVMSGSLPDRPSRCARLRNMRFLLTHPLETRPSLVVDTCLTVETLTIERFRRDLHGLGCANGLLFDTKQCVILRDTYASMDEASIVVEGAPLDTNLVLANVTGYTLEERVERWLEVLSVHWDNALPSEPAIAAPFFANIVPAASGSVLHALKGAA